MPVWCGVGAFNGVDEHVGAVTDVDEGAVEAAVALIAECGKHRVVEPAAAAEALWRSGQCDAPVMCTVAPA
jgi:hypothetical protein